MALTEDQIKNLPVMPSDTQAVAGKDTLIYVALKDSPLTWICLGGQKNSPLSEKADSLDGSDKASGSWKKTLPAMKSWSIDYDGLYVLNDVALDIVRKQFRDGKPAYIRIEYPDGSYKQGWAYITAMSDSNASDAIQTLKITFEGYGEISDLITPAKAAIASPTVSIAKGSQSADKTIAVTPADVTIRNLVDPLGTRLVFGTDYELAAGTLTLKKEYLTKLTASTVLTAKFATGNIPITVTVTGV